MGAPGASPGARIEHRRQRLEIEAHQRRRILGDAPAVGDDERHRLADIGDLVLGEREGIDMETDRRGGDRERNPVAGQQRPQIGEGQDRLDARHCACRRGIDRAQARMGDGAAHERRMKQPRLRQIGDIAALACHQRRVLKARAAPTAKAFRPPSAMPQCSGSAMT